MIEDIDKYKADRDTSYLANEWEKINNKIKDLDSIDSDDDEMKNLANIERKELVKQLEDLEGRIIDISKKNTEEKTSPKRIILEIRAGAGGNEASIFAREVSDMYRRFCEKNNISFTLLTVSENELQGFKEATFDLSGKGVFNYFKYETGVHRVQRIPETEKQGRIHTSTISVAILPVFEKSDMVINPKDLKMEFSRSGGAGGQNVNKVETAVRIIHIPSGIAVKSTEERSQLKNRETAMRILTAKLEIRQMEEKGEDRDKLRRKQVGTAARSEKDKNI